MNITTKNVEEVEFSALREHAFGLIKRHDHLSSLDRASYVQLLGEYPATYQYLAELYTYLIGRVREAGEVKDGFRKMKLMDKRDCLEWALKSVKFQYDSLSRKVTVLSEEDE